MAGNLYDIVESLSVSQSTGGKVRVGYTVNKYDGVLAELKNVLNNLGYSDDVETVMGNDYSELEGIRFDSNNFSTNPEAALWRMEIGLFGSLPIENENSKYQIMMVEGDDISKLTASGNTRQFPFVLSTDELVATQDTMKFESGAFIDIDNHLVAYLNQMFTHGGTVGGRQAFTRDCVQKLVENKCLVAQIIPPNGGSNVEVTIIGRTVVENNSRLMLNPTFVVSSAASALNLPVVIGNYQKEGTTMDVDVTGGSGILNCPLSGKAYVAKDAYVNEMNHKNFKTWADPSRKAETAGESQGVSIKQIPKTQYYVRIYIPSNKRGIAESILPDNVSEGIYNTYTAVSYGSVNKDVAKNVNVERMKECIVAALQREKNWQIWTTDDIKTEPGSNNSKFGWKTNWFLGSDVSTAMAGSFIIPKGWPISPISLSFGNRTPQSQADRGLPTQFYYVNGQKKIHPDLKPWIICDNSERFDSSINVDDARVFSGTMPDEWYSERLRKSNLGSVRVYCSAAAAQNINNFFKTMWQIYGNAAAIYNSGRTEEEKTSAGEIILRCAPCLCRFTGASPIHRNRNGKIYGHDSGRAIDFDYAANGTTASPAVNATREITKGMSTGYAPMLFALKINHGGWGGSVRFDNGKYDAMHVQF